MTLRIGAVLLMLGTQGCSFVFVDGPPRQHAELPYFACSDSRVVPVLDTIFTALQALNLMTALTVSDARWAATFDGDPPFSRSAGIAVYAAFAALGAGGMAYGYNAVAECKEAEEELQLRMAGPPPLPWRPQQP